MKWEVITPPATEPIAWSDAQTHLRLDDTTEQAWCVATIPAVRDYAETALQRSLVTRTLRATWYAHDWLAPQGADYGHPWPGRTLALPRGPVTAITAVTDGAGNAISSSLYALVRIGTVDHIRLAIAVPSSGLVVTYTAGYGDASTVPAKIKLAMLMHLAHWWRNREAVTDKAQRYTEAGLAAIYGQEQAGGLL